MTSHALRRHARTLLPLGTAVLLAVGLSAPVMAPVPAGALPTTYFSDDGRQTTDIGGWEDIAHDVAIQPDDKTVVVGRVDVGVENAPHYDFGLTRYNADGSLDPTFAGDGIQTTDIDDQNDTPTAVALQTDGKIVVTGYTDRDLALVRYNSDGTLDTSFASGGMELTDFGSDFASGSGVAIQSNGKIIASGTVGTSGAVTSYLVARYNTDGSVDTSFGAGGHQLTYSGDGASTAVALQADDKIVVAGSNASRDFVVVRYDSDGEIDDSFSGDGIQTTEIGDQAYARDLGLQPDGRIVAAGSASSTSSPNGSSSGIALARYLPDGTLDDTFSGDGTELTERADTDMSAWGLAIQPDGKIVAGGRSTTGDAGPDFMLARYGADGTLDSSFAGDGIQINGFGPGSGAHAVALRPDGKTTLVGMSGLDFALARYNADGSLDGAPPTPPDPPPSTDPKPTPASSKACTITGNDRRNVIHGTSGRDVICARGGNDVVYGHGGNDLVYGHRGNDRLIGGAGNDRLHGAHGRDTLVGGAGKDLLRGGHLQDRLNTRDRVRGNDSAYGGYGNDSCATNRRDLRRSC
jgi:uncharacterized delta-60 repeat protein